jgi:hypothetical protein
VNSVPQATASISPGRHDRGCFPQIDFLVGAIGKAEISEHIGSRK